MAKYSWVKRMSGYVLGRDRLTDFDGGDPFPSAREDEPAKLSAPLPSTPPGVELAGASIAQWLEEIVQVKSFIAEANSSVRKQMVSIQAAIVFAQDNLSESDEVGRLALKRKIDCAEKFHQKSCQFNKVVGDVTRVTVLMPQLARIIGGLSPEDLADAIGPVIDRAPVDSCRERPWITKQLTRIEGELEQLETCAGDVSADQVSACVACLETVVRLLTRHIDEIGRELGHLVKVIDELDRFIVSA